MFEQDYILRQVQQMVQMLQVILGLKKEKRLDKALQKIDKSYDRFLDLNSDRITVENVEGVITRCSSDGKFSADLGFALGDIVNEEAKILNEQGHHKEANKKFKLALKLYQHAVANKDAAVPIDMINKLQHLEGMIEQNK